MRTQSQNPENTSSSRPRTLARELDRGARQMNSVRSAPRTTGPAQVQAHHAAKASAAVPALNPALKRSMPDRVDAFERKSVTSQLLQRGMTGAGVSKLQQQLVAAKFMSVDDQRSGPGVYGPRTEAAVKRLQAYVGLPVTGIAAPSTLAALASGVRFQPAPAKTRDPESTMPVALARVHAKLSETFTDEVTQPMGRPVLERNTGL